MKRILFDVPRWSICLHRWARGLAGVNTGDPPHLRFEDELFEKLYTGNLDPLPADQRNPGLGPWAERVHEACGQLPAFERLATDCRGDADAAGVAVETLLAELRPQMAEVELRRAARGACARAAGAVEELRDATDGLDQVGFGRGPCTGSAAGEARPIAAAVGLARRLRDDPRLRRIAQLAGRFKRIAASKRRSKVKHGADEISDVEQGADLGRLLPVELARLVHPKLRLAMLRDFSERRCLQYALTGTETLGKGPLVVCLDKSGSMEGEPDTWATAVALALLDHAHRERRPFAVLGFDAAVKHESFVQPGEALPEEALFVSCAGGTSIDRVLERALEIVAKHPGQMRRADVVLITDGASDAGRAAELRARAAALGASVLGFGIGIDQAALMPWCDQIEVATDLTRLEDRAAERLFTE